MIDQTRSGDSYLSESTRVALDNLRRRPALQRRHRIGSSDRNLGYENPLPPAVDLGKATFDRSKLHIKTLAPRVLKSDWHPLASNPRAATKMSDSAYAVPRVGHHRR